MSKLKIRKTNWKGGRLNRMARLLEFKKDEADLFEALSVVFFVADQPSPAENKSSIKAEDAFDKYGVPAKDSKFKTVNCGFCEQRVMKMPRIYTLPDGIGADMVLDDKVFEYIESRFEKWKQITDPAMKRPFEALKERIDAAKANKELQDFDAISKYLKARDNPTEQAKTT